MFDLQTQIQIDAILEDMTLIEIFTEDGEGHRYKTLLRYIWWDSPHLTVGVWDALAVHDTAQDYRPSSSGAAAESQVGCPKASRMRLEPSFKP